MENGFQIQKGISMSKELTQALQSLTQELEKHPELSTDDKASLTRLAQTIESEVQESSLNELEQWVTHFNEEHPSLTKVIRRVMDGLSGMGI